MSDTISGLSDKVRKLGIHYSLEHIYDTLNQLGNPHHSLPDCIHIAGTNGKGSTVAFLKAGLMAEGKTVGTFTSPHLVSYRERIAINDHPISQDAFNTHLTTLKTLPNYDTLTEFEVLTLLSFLYFTITRPDIVLYEVGLGGRLDTTNVITPIACAITKIGYDHEALLGNTLTQIATEKAGIIKPGIPTYTTQQDPEALAALTAADPAITVTTPIRVDTYSLSAPVQAHNAGLAAAVLGHTTGFESAKHWGRYTKVVTDTQTFIIDAAHNTDSCQALIESLECDYPNQKLAFLVGMLNRKNNTEMLEILSQKASMLYLVDFDPSQSLAHSPLTTPWTKKSRPDDPILVITGSIYFIGRFKLEL